MVARLLSRVLNVPPKTSKRKFARLTRRCGWRAKLSPEMVQRIEDMNLRGVFFQKKTGAFILSVSLPRTCWATSTWMKRASEALNILWTRKSAAVPAK